MVGKAMKAIGKGLRYNFILVRHIFLNGRWSIGCDISTRQDSSTTQIPKSPTAKRIGYITDILGNLSPHQRISLGAENEPNDEVLGEDISIESSGVLKYYSSFSQLKPLVEKALVNEPRLIAGESETSNTVNVIKLLHGNLGLGLRVIVRFLTKNPEIFNLNANTLRDRIENLRSLKLREGVLQRSISHTPKLLIMPEKDMNYVANFLTAELDFTMKELPELFLFSPQVFLDPLEVTEDKFQYIFFTMGFKQHNILAKHGVMRYSLDHIRMRHLFLERRGQYQLADKNGSLTIDNPKIRPTICSSDSYFCQEVALCRLDEFWLFKKILDLEDYVREKESRPDRSKPEEFADKLLQEMS